jgi:ribose 5-phosphate isomerase A
MATDRSVQSNVEQKRAAGEHAAGYVSDGMVVGLGTGSTVAWSIRAIGKKVSEGLDILGITTSYQAEALAIECRVPLTSLAEHPIPDLAIDGADQIDRDLKAIKGGGAAHTREKVVASSAKRFVIVADAGKSVDRLNAPVPVEVLPFAFRLAERRIIELGGCPTLRQARMKDGPVITDNGNFVIDADFGPIADPSGLSESLNAIPGVVEHGIFLKVDELVVAQDGAVNVITARGDD